MKEIIKILKKEIQESKRFLKETKNRDTAWWHDGRITGLRCAIGVMKDKS